MADCDEPVDVPGQGPSCPAPGGWALRLPDGAVLFTHGPDPLVVPAPELLPPGPGSSPLPASAPSPASDVGPACVHDPAQPHVQVLYAHPSNVEERSALVVPSIVAGVHETNAILRANALPLGWDVRFKVLCTPSGEVDVGLAPLTISSSGAHFGSIVSDLRELGWNNPRAKYWVVYDGSVGCGCGGQASGWGDDRPGPDNWNNDGGLYALTYLSNYGSRQGFVTYSLSQVMLHEAGHTMGAVQNSAPHPTGAFHCTDGTDIMCYNDGGPTARRFNWFHCVRVPTVYELAATWPFDCNNDDYFHPAPPAGSYLETHWNVGGPNNRYLVRAPL